MPKYVVTISPEGGARRDVYVSADSENEARQKATHKVYKRTEKSHALSRGTRRFTVHNIRRED